MKTIGLGGTVSLYDCIRQTDFACDKESASVTIPAHGTKIFRAKGKKRLERTRYEAETAWLSAYQELRNNQAEITAVYAADNNASGGFKAGYLGMRAENDLQWRNVVARKAGKRQLTFRCFCGEKRSMELEVNGQHVKTLNVGGTDWSQPQYVTVEAHLKEGNNVVRLYNATAWMPDIDVMTIE